MVSFSNASKVFPAVAGESVLAAVRRFRDGGCFYGGGTETERYMRIALLRYLLLNPRRVLTRAQLLEHVWDYDFGGDARVLETYVSYLRKKLDIHGPPLIQTVRGVGYALRAPRT